MRTAFILTSWNYKSFKLRPVVHIIKHDIKFYKKNQETVYIKLLSIRLSKNLGDLEAAVYNVFCTRVLRSAVQAFSKMTISCMKYVFIS